MAVLDMRGSTVFFSGQYGSVEETQIDHTIPLQVQPLESVGEQGVDDVVQLL
jgi:hypothetical protein